ncbi:MAG: RRXRR domain-containing protein [Candidatus Methanospirareceae archaeon]
MRVPVVSVEGKPLMPTTAARARKMIRDGVAVGRFNKLGMFYVQMLVPVGDKTQDVSLAVDPGSKYDGYAVGTPNGVILKGMAKMPAKVADKIRHRRQMRRLRRYRKTWRRKERFDNRKRGDYWLAPSQRAKVEFRLKIIKELCKIFPVKRIAIEDVAYNHYEGSEGKYFSTVEIGKARVYEEIEAMCELVLFRGWQTAEARGKYKIRKSTKKDLIAPESHANDAVALLCLLYGRNVDGSSPFWYWQRPELVRRSLHRDNFQRGGIRPRFGGTSNGNFLRKGDYVEVEKGDRVYRGWVCGLPTDRTRAVGVMDAFGKRIGQFVIGKVRLLCRRTGVMWKVANSSHL